MRDRPTFSDNDPRVLACRKAIRLSGGTAKLARALGITVQAVSFWQIVPAERALRVSLISGVSVHELRPDVFGTEPQRQSGFARTG